MHLLRGKQDCATLSRLYGFYAECPADSTFCRDDDEEQNCSFSWTVGVALQRVCVDVFV